MRTIGRPPRSRDLAANLRAVPDWKQADPRWIRQALRLALQRPSGGWYALDASRNVQGDPVAYTIAGRSLVVWRGGKELFIAPEPCPHLGAPLAGGRVEGCQIICPWHGLALGKEGHAGWKPYPSMDDGVLLWVRLPEAGQEPTDRPLLPVRPENYIDAVVRMEAVCETEDVIANRLDPWHGTHFHPHSFARLKVIERSESSVTCRVVYRLPGHLGVEVDAHFTCPDPRTIVMTIIDGEGTGSVVETHATPLSKGRTAIIEATLASSDRAAFLVARAATPVLRPIIHWAARRLWKEDAAYAEQRYSLRHSNAASES